MFRVIRGSYFPRSKAIHEIHELHELHETKLTQFD